MDDAAARALAQSVVSAGETLLWAEAAPPWPIALASLSGAALCAGIIWWTWSFWRRMANSGLEFWLARVFVPAWFIAWAAGAVFLALQAAKASSLAYAVTDARVLIVAQGPFGWTNEYGVQDIELYAISDTGDLMFRRDVFQRNHNRVYLFDLENPEFVAALIKQHVAPNAQRIEP